jgi:apolipoprotein N-acyltransferase
LLYFACFPPLSAWWLSPIALIPLQLAIFNQSPRRSALLGLATGIAVCFPGFFWLVNLIHTYGGFPVALSILFLLLLSGYQAGQFAFSTWLSARGSRNGWPAELTFPLAFTLGELLYPQVFPWYFGACLHQLPIAIQTADLAGPTLVTLVALIPSVALSSLIYHQLGAPRPRHLVLPLSLCALLVALLYGHIRIRQAESRETAAPSLNVGIVQTNIPMDLKGADGHLHYFKRHLALTEQLQAHGAQLVIWSESALTYVIPEHEIDGFLSRSALSRLHGPILLGTVVEDPNTNPSALWNTALLLDQNGHIDGRYDKHYLLAFGEYIPFGDLLPSLYSFSPATQRFEAGHSVQPLNFQGHTLSVNICYEDILSSFLNTSLRNAPAELLVNLTNDAWFGNSAEPWIHLALAKFRAVEHRRFLVRATNSGVSAIIDSAGRVQAHTDTFVESTLQAKVKFLTQSTIYERVGQIPTYALSLLTAAAAFIRRRPKRAPQSA